tara:strand:- start:226 stop:1599 length:1374 start_codon:yes stop_codon:yes gene_type:complete
MPIDTQNLTYEKNLSKWILVRDCVEGAKQVRSKGVTYLPNPESDDPQNTSHRYFNLKKRAQFLNVTARTRNAMVGMAFRRTPEIDVTGIEYILANATGSGTTLEQLGKIVVGDLLECGRIGLLVDYPDAEPNLSKEKVQALGLISTIKIYNAESIINWKTEVIGGREMLSLVVLREEYSLDKDEFDQSTEVQYRKLCLIGGIYNQVIYRDGVIFGNYSQPKANGKQLREIPFVIPGTYSNDPAVDDAALYDIAEINIGHYINSASYEEGIDVHGQPMLHIDSGTMSAAEWDTLNPNGVEVGARRGIVTNGGGSAQLIQAAANAAAYEAMQQKEKQMVSIGARLIELGGQAETAEAARIKHAGDNSVLANVVQNASEGIQKALTYVNLFMGNTFDPVFIINEDFYDKSLDPQTMIAKIQLFDRGIIGKTDIRATLRKAGEIDREDEDIDDETDDESVI